MKYELRPLGVGGILDQAIRILKDRFGLFLVIMLCSQIPFTLIMEGVTISQIPTLSSRPTPEEVRAFTQSQYKTFLAIVLPLSLLNAVVVTPITNAAIVHATANIYLGRPTSVGQAFRVGLTRFFPFLWTWLLFTLVVTLGTMACIVPGILFLFRYYLATDIAVIERISGIPALRRSRDLMLSHRTKHYNTAFLLGLVIFAIIFGIQQGSQFIPQIYVRMVIAALLQGIAIAFSLIAVVVFYFSCRCRAENFDLVQLAQAVAEMPASEPETGGLR